MNVHVPQWPDLIPTLGSWTAEIRGQLIANQPLDEMTSAESFRLIAKLRKMRGASPLTFSKYIACRWPLAPTTRL